MSARKISFLFLCLCLVLLQNVSCLNVLGVISLPLRSHYMAFQTLFRELAIRGHNITVINNFPDEQPLQNLTFINIDGPKFFTLRPLAAMENLDSTYSHLASLYRHLSKGAALYAEDCRNLFTNEKLKAHRSEAIKYDVIIVEQFSNDCGLAYAATMYDAPIIGITSHTLIPWAYPRLGLPFNAAFDAFYYSNSKAKKSLYQKVEDTVINFLYITVGRWKIQREMYRVIERYLPDSHVEIEQVARERIRMMFVYQHFSLTGARLLAPQVLEIGGIHIVGSQVVPKDIEDFLSKADQGAIYFSFGSNLKLTSMSEKKMQMFLKAFSRVPQKVLWKWENATFPAGYENKIYPSKWLPQLDILCHPKVVAFISHGGMLSLSEAAHCGKPVLAVPFFGDQFSNAAVVVSSGLGSTLMFDKINEDNLVKVINELTSEKIQENAKRISRLWHDRPQNVMDSAIYWTEYVARHDLAPPGLPAQHNTWFENLQLDVYSVLLVLVAAILMFCYKLFIFIVMKLLRLTAATKVKTN